MVAFQEGFLLFALQALCFFVASQHVVHPIDLVDFASLQSLLTPAASCGQIRLESTIGFLIVEFNFFLRDISPFLPFLSRLV